MPRTISECKECKEERTILGRGLCSGCYKRNKRNGTLDRYVKIKKTPEHGTYGMYSRHKREGTEPCQECIEANRKYKREKATEYRSVPVKRERQLESHRKYIDSHKHDQDWREHRREAKLEWAKRRDQDSDKRKAYLEAKNAQSRRQRLDPAYREKENERNRAYMKKKWATDPEYRKKQADRLTERRRIVGTPEYGRVVAQSAKRRLDRQDKTYSGRAATGWELGQRLEYYGHRCWMCGCEVSDGELHWDHVKPISRGGSLLASNLRPACAECNLRKGNQWPYELDRAA